MTKAARKFINKTAWREVGGNKYYFRSLLEFEYANILQVQVGCGQLVGWLHEPKTFYFDGEGTDLPPIKRGVTNYKPDFKVIENDGSHYWTECKGYMDSKSRTKIKRFRKYFPNEKLILYPFSMEYKL